MLPKKPSEGDAEPLRRTTRSRPRRCSPSSTRSPISWLGPSAAMGTRLRQGRRACPEMPSVSPGELGDTHPGVRLAYYLRAIDGEGGGHDSPMAITILPRPGDTCRSSGQGGAPLGSSLQRPKLLPVPRDILAAVGQSHSRPSQGRRQVTFRA